MLIAQILFIPIPINVIVSVQLTVKTWHIRAHARDVFPLLDMEMGRCHVEEISHEADSISIVVEFLQCC